ncbi:MAG: hypothetical protein KF773_25065 [Deltaproteobacteria bacterium]|nr:hypothetical protein [Deltaproteobacteria bacterium]
MSQVPPAIVHGAPMWKRPGARKAAVVVVALGAAYGAFRVARPYLRSDTYKRLAEQHERARAKIGDGLDELFARQLSRESNAVKVVATLAAGAGLDGDLYTADACARGLSDAFKEALGTDVVRFSTYESSDVELVLTGKLAPSGSGFQLPHSQRVFPGIILTGEAKLLDTTLALEVRPPADVQFTQYMSGADIIFSSGPSDHAVASGIMQGTCRELGYDLLEKMTSWKRPAPPKRDPVADCKRGFHCRETAESLEADDPKTAAELYGEACRHDDDVACVRYGELELAQPTLEADRAARLHVTLEMGCRSEMPGACRMAGLVAMPATEHQRAEALVFFLRGCDLGDDASCPRAAALLADTAFADGAPLLLGRRTVATKQFGTAFAVRWGQWTRSDPGQPTLWVTRRPSRLPKGALVRELDGDRIPRGIVPPEGASTVYAIALDGGGDPCDRCNPSGPGPTPFSITPTQCICALAKPPAR